MAALQWPTLVITSVQLCPLGHVLRGSKPQPGVQNPPVLLHNRPESAVPQVASAVDPAQPQMPRFIRQRGLVSVHRVVLATVHSTQAPASMPVRSHRGRAESGQSGAPSALHATQVLIAAAHRGVTPPQSARVRQPTHKPMPEEVSHRGVVAGQCDVSSVVQAAQAPLGRQIGADGPQSAFPVHARQMCVAPSHTGVVPPHWAAERQATQVPEAALHTGVAPLHRVALLVEHWPHAPPV